MFGFDDSCNSVASLSGGNQMAVSPQSYKKLTSTISSNPVSNYSQHKNLIKQFSSEKYDLGKTI